MGSCAALPMLARVTAHQGYARSAQLRVLFTFWTRESVPLLCRVSRVSSFLTGLLCVSSLCGCGRPSVVSPAALPPSLQWTLTVPILTGTGWRPPSTPTRTTHETTLGTRRRSPPDLHLQNPSRASVRCLRLLLPGSLPLAPLRTREPLHHSTRRQRACRRPPPSEPTPKQPWLPRLQHDSSLRLMRTLQGHPFSIQPRRLRAGAHPTSMIHILPRRRHPLLSAHIRRFLASHHSNSLPQTTPPPAVCHRRCFNRALRPSSTCQFKNW